MYNIYMYILTGKSRAFPEIFTKPTARRSRVPWFRRASADQQVVIHLQQGGLNWRLVINGIYPLVI